MLQESLIVALITCLILATPSRRSRSRCVGTSREPSAECGLGSFGHSTIHHEHVVSQIMSLPLVSDQVNESVTAKFGLRRGNEPTIVIVGGRSEGVLRDSRVMGHGVSQKPEPLCTFDHSRRA